MSSGVPSEIRFVTGERPDELMAGLLVAVVQKTNEIGFFETLSSGLNLKMKVCTYTHQNKIETIVAGLAVGCTHVAQMQAKLVPDTVAAGLFGMERFPDQSHINGFLRRCGAEQVAHFERAHEELLLSNTLSGDRRRWLELPDGQRVLPVDLDQTPVVTRSTRATEAASGYFGRKRGNFGYKKSVALLGGDVKEVLWLRLEPGDTHGKHAVPIVLEKITNLRSRTGLQAKNILVRGDSQYGSTGTIREVQTAGYRYMLKGYTPLTAKQLADDLPVSTVWTYRGKDTNGSDLWVADAGIQELRGRDDPADDLAPVLTRVVLLVRVAFRTRSKRGKGSPNSVTEKHVSYEHYVTDFGPDELSAGAVIDLYNGRETEESFFRAEQDAFGAQYLRTHQADGERAFLWLLASTVNLLRWVQESTFAATELQEVGLSKLVHQAMRIPATIIREAEAWIVVLPDLARLVRQLVSAWVQRTAQLPLPLCFDGNSP
jgi:hypothetical protein